jgi:putative intracellular protease/amidase
MVAPPSTSDATGLSRIAVIVDEGTQLEVIAQFRKVLRKDGYEDVIVFPSGSRPASRLPMIEPPIQNRHERRAKAARDRRRRR